MSLLHAADHAQKARELAHSMSETLSKLKARKQVRQELVESCQGLTDHVNRIVAELEHALVRADETVAVTFFPFRQSDIEGSSLEVHEAETVYKTETEVPERTSGTIILPFTPPDEDAE